MATAQQHTNEIKGNAVQSSDRLRDGIREVGRAVSEVTEQTLSDAKDLGSQVIDSVSRQASQMGEKGMAQAQAAEKQLEERIKQYPLGAVVAGACFGIAVGMLLKRS